jgi:hypothetical protein
LLFSIFQGKDAIHVIKDYMQAFPDTNRAKSAVKQKERQVCQHLFEKAHPPVNNDEKSGSVL